MLGLLIGGFLKLRLKVGIGWTYQIFSSATAVCLACATLHVDIPGRQLLALAAIFFAAFPLNALLYRFLWPLYGYPGENARVPPFLPQIASLLLIATALFTGLSLIYGVTLPGLLAGSGLVALVLGLALQDTLGNIFAGVRPASWESVPGRRLADR
jgi:small-conductance mechanosensitive channel